MSFVVSAGEIRSTQAVSTVWGPGQGMYNVNGPTASIPTYAAMGQGLHLTYSQIWRTQPAVRTVVGFLARNIAQLGVDTYQKLSPNNRVKLTDHPVARLLERPFPGTKWTKYRLLNTIMQDLCIYDDAYILKLRADGGALALLPIPPSKMQPLGMDIFMPTQYRLYGTRGFQDLEANDVIHISGYNPDDPRHGLSPIETLRTILAEEYAATRYREQLWRNGARTAGYIKRPKDAARWSDSARTRFRDEWQSLYTSDGPQSGSTPVLEDGMEFASTGVTPRDAQYVESRKLTREEVAVAYHVPPVMVGMMEGATFTNVTEYHKNLYQDTLAPYLTQLAQDLENQLLEDVDPSAADGSIYIEFNMSEKLRGSFAEQASAFQSAVGGPWMTRAEARAMNNLPEIDAANELIVPLNVTEGGLASPNDTAPNNPNNAASNGQLARSAVLRKHYARMRQTLMSRAVKDVSDVDDRWQRELAADLDGLVPDADADADAVHADVRARLHKAFTCHGANPYALGNAFDELIRECE